MLNSIFNNKQAGVNGKKEIILSNLKDQKITNDDVWLCLISRLGTVEESKLIEVLHAHELHQSESLSEVCKHIEGINRYKDIKNNYFLSNVRFDYSKITEEEIALGGEKKQITLEDAALRDIGILVSMNIINYRIIEHLYELSSTNGDKRKRYQRIYAATPFGKEYAVVIERIFKAKLHKLFKNTPGIVISGYNESHYPQFLPLSK